MGSFYDGADLFPASILLPDDGDSKSAAVIDAPFEALADRTKNLKLHKLDGVDGGTYTPTSIIAVSGAGFTVFDAPTHFENSAVLLSDGAVLTVDVNSSAVVDGTLDVAGQLTIKGAQKILFDERALVRTFDLRGAQPEWTQTMGSVLQASVSYTTTADAILDLPHESVLYTVKVFLQPIAGHAALPSTKPRLTVWRRHKNTGNAEDLGHVDDTSATVSAYETAHAIVVDFTAGLPYAIDRENYVYFAALTGESGTNALANLYAWAVEATFHVTKLDEGT